MARRGLRLLLTDRPVRGALRPRGRQSCLAPVGQRPGVLPVTASLGTGVLVADHQASNWSRQVSESA
jgi:hypothetical protein